MDKFDPTGPKSKEQLERLYREISGVNPGADAMLRDEEAQRIFIAKVMQGLMQNTDPMVLTTMLVVALGFMSDEHGYNRQHIADLLLQARQHHTLEVVGKAPNVEVP